MRATASISALAGAGGGVVERPCATLGQEARAGLGDDRVVFGVDAGERAGVARDGERAQDLPVVEADIVGGEDLEGAVALRDQRGEVGLELRRPVGEDQVEGVVDGRARVAPRGVVGGGVREALTLGLRGEGDDGGRPAHGRRPRGGLERVGVHLAHAGHLFDMAMGIDTAGGDDEARKEKKKGPGAGPGRVPLARRGGGRRSGVRAFRPADHRRGRHDARLEPCATGLDKIEQLAAHPRLPEIVDVPCDGRSGLCLGLQAEKGGDLVRHVGEFFRRHGRRLPDQDGLDGCRPRTRRRGPKR
jgi:hypothetical protein